ncbi:chaperone protein DnaJ-like [Branchiostoma lanceolatum]|uniref:chaperone protein DnaJ-like n=1 Tax=Branchiostoma lanceolatum TaxID=7740 RepID=UPI003453398B
MPYFSVPFIGHSAFITTAFAADKQDHYEVLDVPRNAESADIKRAFRRLAAEHHPDKNKDPGAETRFREIVEAYEVLTHEELRAVYDKEGQSGVEKFKREGQASETQRFRKRQFDIQIEEIIAELLMLFKFARKTNGPRGPN